jgi:hypothetical protein
MQREVVGLAPLLIFNLVWPRFFVDNGRMKYYEERLNELLHDEIDTFRGKKSR